MGRTPARSQTPAADRPSALWPILTLAAALAGLALLLDSVRWTSATYDEVAYLRVAAQWWRTGQQDEITRMGSPLLFWKLQQAPVLWLVDRLGGGVLIDDPIQHQEALLPLVRAGAAWLWLLALGLCACWSRRLYGPRAMALAAWLFALSPNLLAHGGLATMEMPLAAVVCAMLLCFWLFLTTARRGWLAASAVLGGLAFSCKFTTVLFPPILAAVWWLHERRQAGLGGATNRTITMSMAAAGRVATGMTAFVVIMLAANFVLNGLALLPLSGTRGAHPSIPASLGRLPAAWLARLYETPLPQDWVGFATQVHHQLSGGPSYLLGERRMRGWRHYYFVAMAVKAPLTLALLVLGRALLARRGSRGDQPPDAILPLVMVLFLAATAAGSSRNYGLRYLLPIAPLAIIWISRLAECPAAAAWRWPAWPRRLALLGLAGQAAAVASVHPFELTYFNVLAGGPLGGRHVLSDSNLDWGQGLKGLARLQRAEPEFRDLTLYYFGDTEPFRYGVAGASHVLGAVGDLSWVPAPRRAATRYLAVSASLQWGPWAPEGFFRELDALRPVRMTDDTTIAIYRTADLAGRAAASPPRPGLRAQ